MRHDFATIIERGRKTLKRKKQLHKLQSFENEKKHYNELQSFENEKNNTMSCNHLKGIEVIQCWDGSQGCRTHELTIRFFSCRLALFAARASCLATDLALRFLGVAGGV